MLTRVWSAPPDLTEEELYTQLVASNPLHLEVFQEVVAHPAFSPSAAAALGLMISRAGIVRSDYIFQLHVPSLPLLARAACEFAIHWWFSDGLRNENLAMYGKMCEQVANAACFEEALTLLQDADLSNQYYKPDVSNTIAMHLCSVAAVLVPAK